ncbi:RNA polymerase sigma factor [Alicyclobacillus sp. SP_1]|uniref:RNA polymerase sigma factor n=1 Tax=Alicyclobacillus sp. SP_1 TaxID=2942475 RepID=UPI002157A1A3|nr:RNA polymerase sigma factor [Alicyclobacillus sp. SP_1]
MSVPVNGGSRKGGESTTFEELYELHRPSLQRFALALTRDPDRADDLVQETFVRALRHLSRLAEMDDGHLRGWLFTVLRNVKRDEDRRTRFIVDYPYASHFPMEAGVSDLSNHLEWTDLLNRLPAELRAILVQRYWNGLNSREIAKRTGTNPSTVRSQVRRAIQMLQTEMTNGEYGTGGDV